MPQKFIPQPAYPGLRQHPLAGAFLAIFWALLLVASVASYSFLRSGEAFAGGGSEDSPERPLSALPTAP